MKTAEIVSINMAINRGDVEKRYHNLNEYLLEARPDIVSVQEVSSDVGYTALRATTQRLGPDYEIKYDTIYPGQENDQGAVIISRLPIRGSYPFSFSDSGNQAQVATLSIASGKNIGLANGHLEAMPWQGAMRRRKGAELSAKLYKMHPDDQQVITIDSNSLPFYPVIRDFKSKHGFVSAYEAVHGKEPEFTYPGIPAQELLDGEYLKPKEYRFLRTIALARKILLIANQKLPHYTIDYILTNRPDSPKSAHLVPTQRGLDKAFSDHLGIQATLSL